MSVFLQDLKFAVRVLRKNVGFTLVALCTLGLGIGATTAIFSLVNGVLLEPVPFREPDQLVHLTERDPENERIPISFPDFLDWQERQNSFEFLAGHRYKSYNLTGRGRARLLQSIQTTYALFPILGVEAQLGRFFTEAEDRPGGPAVAVLSHRFWTSQLGADPEIIGQRLTLDNEPFEVVGVMPPSFQYPLDSRNIDLWLSLGRFVGQQDYMSYRGNHSGTQATGRLRQGVSVESAREEMVAISAALAEEFPETNTAITVNVTALQSRVTESLRPALLVLTGAVGLVLLIACVNVANLLLARATGREQEVALRVALGASRRRLVRQLLTESTLLSVLGGVLGLLLARLGLMGVLSLVDPTTLPVYADVSMNQSVLLFTICVSVATGALFGLAPAIQATSRNLASPMRDGVRASSGPSRQRLRAALVVTEVALALLLLVGSTLFLQTLENLLTTSPGFDPRNVLTFEVDLSDIAYPEAEQVGRFYYDLRDRIASIPGVESVSHTLPLLGGWQASISVEGLPLFEPGDTPDVEVQRVGLDYFKTVGLTLIRGRAVDETDRSDSLRVAVIDETFAKRFWPDENPIGKRFMFGRPDGEEGPQWMEIVGVVNHVKTYGVDQPSVIQAYVPASQSGNSFTHYVVKSQTPQSQLLPLIESEVAALDANQPIANVRYFEDILGRRVNSRRVVTALVTLFAWLALAMAAVGIYGVMAFMVTQRTRELGIRLALGASSRELLGMVLRRALGLTAVGIGVGLVLSFALAPYLSSLLFRASVQDLRMISLVGLAVLIISVLSCLVPAIRATRVNPVRALTS